MEDETVNKGNLYRELDEMTRMVKETWWKQMVLKNEHLFITLQR